MRHGFLLIDKPVGPTSHDIVMQIRRDLEERKVGHLGTLDPLASGLLVLAVGAKALKVVELYKALDKEYEADILFGATSTTYDAEGMLEEVPERAGWSPSSRVELANILRDQFLGTKEQVPPIYSAIKMGGTRAYRKARQGRDIPPPSRKVRIDVCDILYYAYPELRLRIACAAGTYIRSVAHDLGQRMRCGAYLSALRRIKVGEWSLEDAVSPNKVRWTDVIPLKKILSERKAVDLTETEVEDIRYGRDIEKEVEPNTIAWFEGLPIAILEPCKDGSRMAHARKVL